MPTKEDCQQRGEHTTDNQGLCWWCGKIVDQYLYDQYFGPQPPPPKTTKRKRAKK